MCGIAGVFHPSESHRRGASLADATAAMAKALGHRGPDGSGTWTDDAAGIGLAHTRLAILDLSEAGHQPMVSHCGRFVLSYNGEIFNGGDLRDALAKAGHAVAWRGHSDTEILLEACGVWGVEAAVRRLVGMFAFALWDRAERRLTLVRDRVGIKPLFWGQEPDGRVVFGSELKALRALSDSVPGIDREALSHFLRHAYVPAPWSIYQGIRKVEPGTLVEIAADGAVQARRYWDFPTERQSPLSDGDAIDRLEAMLQEAVRIRMVSDVPIGVLLSGGIDSSLVAALMQEAAGATPVRSFSIGFGERGFDESAYAREVARRLGTRHTELQVTAKDALDLVPDLPMIFDEPHADSSQIPTYLLSRLCREHVTVVLSGDGGDEVFSGYTRYLWAAKIERLNRRLPPAMRRALGAVLRAVPYAAWDRVLGGIGIPAIGHKIQKLSRLVAAADTATTMSQFVAHWQDSPTTGGNAPRLEHGAGEQTDVSLLDRLRAFDSRHYLPENILSKVDRASMACGLEVRVPLLDHRVVEYGWSLPEHMRLRDGQGKWLLRQVLYRRLPQELFDRPKAGFVIPLGQWLRGPLRPWVEDMLNPDRMRADGLIRPEPVQAVWKEHLAGRRNSQFLLWNVLMFQAWKQRWS